MKRTFSLAILLIALMPGAASAIDLEDQVKAAFLLNFAKFVSWPDEKAGGADDPLRLCIVNDPSRATNISALLGQKLVGQRRVEVANADVAEARACHIAFVGESDQRDAVATLQQLTGSQTLIVYESSEPLPAGVIRFFLLDRKVRFEINTRAANDESLQISSKLLRVATIRND